MMMVMIQQIHRQMDHHLQDRNIAQNPAQTPHQKIAEVFHNHLLIEDVKQI